MRLRFKFGPGLVGILTLLGSAFAQQQPAPVTLQQAVQIAMEENSLREQNDGLLMG